MRLIQSFWSCNQSNLLEFNAGWLSPEYNLISWALSCLQLKQFYPEVTLYADNVAAKMLIDTLRLPYDRLVCDLDALSNFHPQLWALPKVYTYGKQEAPFLHVDGDVFIWEQFDKALLQSKLIVQNEEAATNYYEGIMESLESELSYFPPEIMEERESKQPIHAFNAGIMGGHDIVFFKAYFAKAFQFIERNTNSFSKINVSNFNIFFEQYLFYCLVKKEKRQVAVLIDKVIGDNEYKGLGDFTEVPYAKKYLHLLGNYKRNKQVCDQLADRLRQDYPEYYYRIISLFKSKKIPLFRDYYWFESDTSEQSLLAKHHLLKHSHHKNKHSKTEEKTISNSNLPELVFCRVSLAESMIEFAKVNNLEIDFSKNLDLYLSDLNQFEDALRAIVKTKFNEISKIYLLARDISSTKYSENIFGDTQTIYDKLIVADSLAKKIESQFDWPALNPDDGSIQISIMEMIQLNPVGVYTLVIPECDQRGYSLASIDELDCLLLQMLIEPKTIGELFDQIKFAFDPDDLASSLPEFERLIFGRIKKGLQNKSIKAVIHFMT